MDIQAFLSSHASEEVSQKRLMSSDSSSELSRCLVEWQLNSFLLLPPASHQPKGCPAGRGGSDPRSPVALSRREVAKLNRCVFAKDLEALA